MSTAKVKKALKSVANSVSVKDGVYTARRSFFYTRGRTAASFAAEVLAAVPTAKVVDNGEVTKPFRGGASVAQSSHWFVTFTVPVAERGAT